MQAKNVSGQIVVSNAFRRFVCLGPIEERYKKAGQQMSPMPFGVLSV